VGDDVHASPPTEEAGVRCALAGEGFTKSS
jgi:hypothetical protein